MQFIIVTGMSGAGKSSVLKFLEDMEFFCVDNLPPTLIPKFAEICFSSSQIEKIAIGVDVRGGAYFNDLIPALDELKERDYFHSILYLDASDEVLVNRYKETRHSHPLAKNDRVINGIEKERSLLEEMRKRSDFIIDTSHILIRQLKEKITEIVIDKKDFNSLMITVISFGFKFGIPTDCDLVFDVRFIANPFYVQELKAQTGNDAPVHDYVMACPESVEFLKKLDDMIKFLLPNYIKEGKNQLVIGIGCTGGKHRSVTLANELVSILANDGENVIIRHRDILH